MFFSKPVKCGLVLCVAIAAWTATARAGHVEDRDGKTIVHLTLWQIPDPTRTETNLRADAAVVAEFKDRFPEILRQKYRSKYQADPEKYGRHNWDNVEIQLKQATGIQVTGVENDLLMIAGGVAPDVLYVNFRKSDSYIQQNFLYPLDKPEDNYLASLSQEELEFRVHPKIWPVIRRKGPEGEKHVWALPYGGALGKVVLYRKDLFDEAGVPYPHNDWTWDDLYSACKKLTDTTRGIYGLATGRGRHESWFWVTFLWSSGGNDLEYDEAADQWRAVFDSPEAAVALDFYTRLQTEPWFDKNGRQQRGYTYRDPDVGAKWERGEIAMQFAYIDERTFVQLNPDITGLVPVPLGPTGVRGAELNSRMMGLFGAIKDPVVRDAAWEYLRFYESIPAAEIRTKIMVEGGLGRFINPKYLEMFGYPELIRLSPKGWSDIFRIAIETGRPEPYGKNSNVAYDIMTGPMEQAEALALAGQLPDESEARLKVMQDLLREGVQVANIKMIGLVPPDVRTTRRVTALVMLVCIVVGFTYVFRRIMQVFTPPRDDLQQQQSQGWGFRRYAWAYLLLVPAILTVAFWQYIPLAFGSVMAFQDYRLLGGSRWVWLDNFGDVLWEWEWWQSILNSLRYSFLVIALTFLPPVGLAILLTEVPKGKILFRTIYYLPAVTTALVTIILWKQFYDSSDRGVLNAMLSHIPAGAYLAAGAMLLWFGAVFARRLWFHESYLPAVLSLLAGLLLCYTAAALSFPIFGITGEWFHNRLWAFVKILPTAVFWGKLHATLPEPYRWLSDPSTAMFCCVLPMVWAGVGPGCLIYLAALKGIGDDYYDAGDVDGATFIDKILFIVFPILKPLLIINFVGVFIGSWHSASNILALTGGGANTRVAELHIFYEAFVYLHMGPATAMAWMLGFMLIGFTVYQLRILSRLEFRTAGTMQKK